MVASLVMKAMELMVDLVIGCESGIIGGESVVTVMVPSFVTVLSSLVMMESVQFVASLVMVALFVLVLSVVMDVMMALVMEVTETIVDDLELMEVMETMVAW